MRNTIILFYLLVSLLGCTSRLSEKEEPRGTLSEITGKIENGAENRLCIITDWERRSRVSHYIINRKFSSKLQKKAGYYTRVKGYIQENEKNPFVKEIYITEIISVSKNVRPEK